MHLDGQNFDRYNGPELHDKRSVDGQDDSPNHWSVVLISYREDLIASLSVPYDGLSISILHRVDYPVETNQAPF